MAKRARGEAPTLGEFSNLITAEDELGSVLRAHLIIEFHVGELLEALAPNPSALASMELGYFGKVKLLGVLGVADGLVRPLSNLGTLRNSFAHQRNYSLTKERMTALFECFDSESQQLVRSGYEKTRNQPPNQGKYPDNMWDLSPKDQFPILASGIRFLLQSSLGRAKAARAEAPGRVGPT
jgi:hypothetical protein